jgi:hypothetical protein
MCQPGFEAFLFPPLPSRMRPRGQARGISQAGFEAFLLPPVPGRIRARGQAHGFSQDGFEAFLFPFGAAASRHVDKHVAFAKLVLMSSLEFGE